MVSLFVYRDTDYPEGPVFIAYCPELDLTGADITAASARRSFNIVLRDYLDYGLQNGTLEDDLAKHGWVRGKDGRICQPSNSAMLKEKRVREILRQNEYHKYAIPVAL